jgi:hypothetical protein
MRSYRVHIDGVFIFTEDEATDEFDATEKALAQVVAEPWRYIDTGTILEGVTT